MDFSNPKTTNVLLAIVGVAIAGSLLSATLKKEMPSPPSITGRELTQLEAQIGELKAEVSAQATSIRLLKLAQQQMKRLNSTATFDVTDERFQQVDSSYQAFLISVHDVKPYGDGTRLTIKVGNVTAADFSGVTLSLKYGRRAPENEDGTVDLEEISKPFYAAKDKEHRLLERVRAASWNPTTVTLPGIKPDELGYVTIGLTTDQVSLARN
jgi:hypothetical protein